MNNCGKNPFSDIIKVNNLTNFVILKVIYRFIQSLTNKKLINGTESLELALNLELIIYKQYYSLSKLSQNTCKDFEVSIANKFYVSN